MQVGVHPPLAVRDARLDLFRGLANWAIFLDHIPHEVLSSLATKNYGFSDAADIFVFDLGSDFRWRYRFVAYDDRSILLDLVQRRVAWFLCMLDLEVSRDG